VALAAALVLAAAVRLDCLSQKPFWRDEAWVANLVRAPLSAVIAGPRSIPIGFVALVKAVVAALPHVPPEISMRLLPLSASLLALVLLPPLARRLHAPPMTDVVAVWLGAGMSVFVYYARELKAHGLDLLVAVLVPLLALRLMPDDDTDGTPARWQRWAALYLLLAVQPWITFGAAFLVAAVLACFAIAGGRRGSFAWRVAWAGGAAIWLASLAAAYRVALAIQVNNPRLLRFWSDELAVATGRGPLGFARALLRFHEVLLPYLASDLGAWGTAIVVALVCLGVGSWSRSSRRILCGVWLLTATLASMAAVAGLWVLGPGRLLLFAAPPVLLFAAAGLVRLAAWLPGSAPRWAPVALAVFACVVWSAESVLHRRRPFHPQADRYFRYDILHDVEPLIAAASAQAAPHEPVLVSRFSAETFLFYANGRLPQATICRPVACPDDQPVVEDWLTRLHGRGFVLLLEEEAPARRQQIANAGCTLRRVGVSRGALLWEVRPSSRAPG